MKSEFRHLFPQHILLKFNEDGRAEKPQIIQLYSRNILGIFLVDSWAIVIFNSKDSQNDKMAIN